MYGLSSSRSDYSSDTLLEALHLWASIPIGSLVQLEADLYEGDERLLSRGRLYEILAKTEAVPGQQMFIVESELLHRLVELHPGLICNYLDNQEPVHFA